MQDSRGVISSQPGRLEALRAKHAVLKSQIAQEQKSPATSSEALKIMKIQKLKLKEQIEEEKQMA